MSAFGGVLTRMWLGRAGGDRRRMYMAFCGDSEEESPFWRKWKGFMWQTLKMRAFGVCKPLNIRDGWVGGWFSLHPPRCVYSTVIIHWISDEQEVNESCAWWGRWPDWLGKWSSKPCVRKVIKWNIDLTRESCFLSRSTYISPCDTVCVGRAERGYGWLGFEGGTGTQPWLKHHRETLYQIGEIGSIQWRPLAGETQPAEFDRVSCSPQIQRWA